jgi:hypothetical protein
MTAIINVAYMINVSKSIILEETRPNFMHIPSLVRAIHKHNRKYDIISYPRTEIYKWVIETRS